MSTYVELVSNTPLTSLMLIGAAPVVAPDPVASRPVSVRRGPPIAHPHFRIPLQVLGTRFAVVEQDTPADIAECVRALVSTRPGQRDDLPEMGIPSPLFQRDPDLPEIERQLATYEPRSQALLDEHRDRLNDALSIIEVRANG